MKDEARPGALEVLAVLAITCLVLGAYLAFHGCLFGADAPRAVGLLLTIGSSALAGLLYLAHRK